MVEAMQRVWTGKELDETAPIVRGMTIDGKSAIDNVRIKAGTLFKAEVSVTDKENDSLAYVWEVLKEATVLGFEVLMSHVRKEWVTWPCQTRMCMRL